MSLFMYIHVRQVSCLISFLLPERWAGLDFVTSSFLSKYQKRKLKLIIANVSAFMYKYLLGFILIHLLL